MNTSSNAYLSDCRKYRYALWRIWDDSLPYALFIGLNPSTADENKDDPTIRRCIGFAKSWGYGGLYMGNLFAYRATSPKDMMAQDNPIGDENDVWLKKLAYDAGIIIAAWGNEGAYMKRSTAVRNLIQDLHYLKINKSGEPKHPLYIAAKTTPIKYKM